MTTWKKISPSDPPASCNHVAFPGNVLDGPSSCTAPAAWRTDTTCGCGAIHSELRRCDGHRITDLEKEVANTRKIVESMVAYARKLNPDIRTDEECILFAAGFRQNPRDDGDELWKKLNAADVAERN